MYFRLMVVCCVYNKVYSQIATHNLPTPPMLGTRGGLFRPRVDWKQTLRSLTMASLLWWNTVRDAAKTRKSVQRLAFWIHRAAMMAMHGHGQPAPRVVRAGPARFSTDSENRSTV